MIKAISGFQTGADRAAIVAAKACGFETGGWMPKGFLAEDGEHPEFADAFGALEMATDSYPSRTQKNVAVSDVTLWFEWTNRASSNGYWCTAGACKAFKNPIVVFHRCDYIGRPADYRAGLLRILRPSNTCNFAGSRESKAPGIYAWVYGLLTEVFTELKGEQK